LGDCGIFIPREARNFKIEKKEKAPKPADLEPEDMG
jgi:hypothetical protein